MPLERQLSISVKNKVGSLSEICDIMSGGSINIRAMYTVDHVETGIVGLIVDNLEKARDRLAEHGFKFGETNVLTITLSNRPGMLANISKKLAEHNINIVQTFATAAGDRGMLILLTTDDKRAEQLLKLDEIV